MGSRKIHKKTIVLALFLLMMLVPLCQATYYTLYSLDFATYADQSIGLAEVHPASTSISAVAQSVTGDGKYLVSASFWMFKTDLPTGFIKAGLWNSSTNLVESSTTTFTLAEITAGTVYQNASGYTFDFSGTTALTLGATYYVGVYIVNGTIGAAKTIQVAVDSTAPAGSGQNSHYEAGAWDTSTADMIGYIITSETLGGDADPPSYNPSGWDTTDTEGLIEGVAEFLVPLAVMLTPAILFIIFFKRTDKWLILIGLAIGTGLGFYFGMIPVWLVFLVAIGLIGLAYSEVRRNG